LDRGDLGRRDVGRRDLGQQLDGRGEAVMSAMSGQRGGLRLRKCGQTSQNGENTMNGTEQGIEPGATWV
jgi:hypothetical protein